MKPRPNPFSGYGLPALLSIFLLTACGQTGELYMPQPHSTPPPPPRASKMKKTPLPTTDKTTAAPTENAEKRN